MTNGSHKSIVFTPTAPPALHVREVRDADRAAVTVEQQLKDDPQEAILLYGHMRTDVAILSDELRGLEFSAEDYRSKLRVVRSAALRLADRAAKLLGEAS